MRGFLECCGYRPSDVTPLDELMKGRNDPGSIEDAVSELASEEDALAHVATDVDWLIEADEIEWESFKLVANADVFDGQEQGSWTPVSERIW